MSYKFVIRAMILLVLSSFLLVSCQENDDLYGVSPDEYTPNGTDDAAAARYFANKKMACVQAKSDLDQIIPDGWVSISLLVREADGGITPLPTAGKVYADMNFNYEVADGGIMNVSTVNRFGYRKDFSLHPCNAKDSYFYILDSEDDGKVINEVFAFSVAKSTLPPAIELGEEFSLRNDAKIVGIMINRDADPAVPSLRERLGGTLYLGHLLRYNGCVAPNLTDPVRGNLPTSSIYDQCRGVTMNGITLDRYLTFLSPVGYRSGPNILFYDVETPINDANSKGPTRIADNEQWSMKRSPVSVYRGTRLLYRYTTWVSNDVSSVTIRF